MGATDLDGRTFVATAADGHELVPGSIVSIDFDGTHVGGTGGCNSFGGSTWSLAGGRLVVTGLGMTEMACDPPALMAQDEWFASFLGAGPLVALDGDTLTLTGGDASLVLTDRALTDPDRELTGTSWQLDSLIAGDAVSSVPLEVERTPTLVVGDGQVEVDAGCNTGSGPITVGDGTIEFGPLTTTLILCDGAVGAVETHVLAVLQGTAEYVIDADQLTLTNGDRGLVFRAGD